MTERLRACMLHGRPLSLLSLSLSLSFSLSLSLSLSLQVWSELVFQMTTNLAETFLAIYIGEAGEGEGEGGQGGAACS